MGVSLRTIQLPELPTIPLAPPLTSDEYQQRCTRLYERANAEWVVIYGDREHAANLVFLCGFDPRFEEALLLLGPNQRRILVVGNEGLGYVPAAARLYVEPFLAQSLSLMGQPRRQAPRLSDVFSVAGIGQGSCVGVVGWKYLEPEECDDPHAPAFVPAMLVDSLRRVVGPSGAIRDATAVLMHPTGGLRHRNSANQIALFAEAALRSSQAVFQIIRGTQPGMREHDAARLAGYQGDPFTCHMMLASAAPGHDLVGLASPGNRLLHGGDGITTAIGYWGGLCCRAGLLRQTPDQSFFRQYVEPYYQAIATWWQALRIGVTGGMLHDCVHMALRDAPFAPALNPGHLIAIDEWSHSPIRPDSNEPIASGMLFQCDIIPTPLPAGTALNCEDTVAVADEALRGQIRAQYPELWRTIEARRSFMNEALGIRLADEVLPLSLAPAYLPPFWLAPDLACTLVAE